MRVNYDIIPEPRRTSQSAPAQLSSITCLLCNRLFERSIIESHASDCQGPDVTDSPPHTRPSPGPRNHGSISEAQRLRELLTNQPALPKLVNPFQSDVAPKYPSNRGQTPFNGSSRHAAPKSPGESGLPRASSRLLAKLLNTQSLPACNSLRPGVSAPSTPAHHLMTGRIRQVHKHVVNFSSPAFKIPGQTPQPCLTEPPRPLQPPATPHSLLAPHNFRFSYPDTEPPSNPTDPSSGPDEGELAADPPDNSSADDLVEFEFDFDQSSLGLTQCAPAATPSSISALSNKGGTVAGPTSRRQPSTPLDKPSSRDNQAESHCEDIEEDIAYTQFTYDSAAAALALRRQDPDVLPDITSSPSDGPLVPPWLQAGYYTRNFPVSPGPPTARSPTTEVIDLDQSDSDSAALEDMHRICNHLGFTLRR
ncbi:hypothetical protein H4R33_004532 [Dimargaris cristalligena]|nr:hypothetical protein H4R33_004532 [Dimargaris cristalligena]